MKTKLAFKFFFWIALNDLLDTSAQLLMKKGLGRVDFDSLTSFTGYFLQSHHFDMLPLCAGLSIYIFNFFLWMYILSKVQLSVALPLASVSYVLIPIASIIFLHEHVPSLRWVGLTFIVIGIYLISQSSSEAQKE